MVFDWHVNRRLGVDPWIGIVPNKASAATRTGMRGQPIQLSKGDVRG
ncbi:hypothetical protein PVAP13_3KG050900 [Panicum virgatum]|uniref:Uncharacterized protein n=1 Tax=Panicum virgatum TaxID=38727 RepID=A0A8T0UQ77_PANVG|nr:hypothetical protein PVAP13_3KG050900 [Panicum virgatum]